VTFPPAAAVGQTRGLDQLETPFSPSLVEELLRLIAKTARAHQLYLPNNPIYRGAIDSLRAGFVAIWNEADDITLVIAEGEFLWHDVPVWRDAAGTSKTPDSLPWLFYKDGVRELTLTKGFEEQEALTFLEMIQRARKATADEDDLDGARDPPSSRVGRRGAWSQVASHQPESGEASEMQSVLRSADAHGGVAERDLLVHRIVRVFADLEIVERHGDRRGRRIARASEVKETSRCDLNAVPIRPEHDVQVPDAVEAAVPVPEGAGQSGVERKRVAIHPGATKTLDHERRILDGRRLRPNRIVILGAGNDQDERNGAYREGCADSHDASV